MKLPASVRCWPLLWSPPLLIQSPSDQGATSRPGSVSCRSSTRVVARTGSATRLRRAPALLQRAQIEGVRQRLRIDVFREDFRLLHLLRARLRQLVNKDDPARRLVVSELLI